MRSYKTEGIVVKRKNFGEADRILTIFTKKNGKIKIKAIGVRKINSRRSPHVELLNYSLLTLYKGHNLPILTEAQTINSFQKIKNDLTKIGFAYYLCELIDGLCPEGQENKIVFSLLKDSLQRLASEQEAALIIEDFEVNLLTFLGFYRRSYQAEKIDLTALIENLLERKLKTKQILPCFKK